MWTERAVSRSLLLLSAAIWFMADGRVLQTTKPNDFFGGHEHPRAGTFLQSVLKS
ncbi:hypothetical protein Arad_8119 [Rhizobium rhizogenes K84]|uniref:Uncharacterized protein n=1 Tax=Rhizobium rhizogenes (strain K84 / ATCC BAA-868) TaxID=311403 RepID=B9JHS4_RHIR8|nr:hypothetical protein Arad_8119 [Rhizobium rhizogenes K84]